ncbi:response regulator [[Empedobacter] haloabium]|uniref:Response regulator n=1 Tax=[Empedobacter] haloabium TaxID=592317 RepID=A0ABZ1UEY0_9BURK
MMTATLITPFRPGDRILVACGDRAAAEALARVFVTSGFTVRLAFDGVSALDKARTFFPSVAVLGMDLQYLDGFQLARALRTIPGCARMRILAMLGRDVGLLDRHRCFDYILRAPRPPFTGKPLWKLDGDGLAVKPTIGW